MVRMKVKADFKAKREIGNVVGSDFFRPVLRKKGRKANEVSGRVCK